MKNLLLFVLLVLAQGCSKQPDATTPMLSGTYTGQFNRASFSPVPVSISFDGNRFSGSITGSTNPSESSYPRICSGTFSQSERTINFQNECTFTAEFDWTLILGGEWEATQQGNEVILLKNKDKYVLSKK